MMPTETNTTPTNSSTTYVGKVRKRMFWAGIIMVVLGVAAIMMPLLSSLLIEVLVGWLLAISGALTIIGAFSLRDTGVFWWELASGLLALVAGVLLLAFPLGGLVALTVLVAVVMLFTGLAQGLFALWIRPADGWIWGIVSAIVSIVLATYILMALPVASTVFLGLLLGIDFVSTGTALVLISRVVPKTT